MTNSTNAIYNENGTKLPWPNKLGSIYDENQIGQRYDLSIDLFNVKTKIELSGHIWLGAVCDEN